MSGRTVRGGFTQGIDYQEYAFTILGAGAAAPTFVEGDKAGASSGAYITIARTGVGVYTLTTIDPFPAIVATGFQPRMGTPAGQFNVVDTYPAVQNANKTWTITINSFSAAVATELTSTIAVSCWLMFRNSIGKP